MDYHYEKNLPIVFRKNYVGVGEHGDMVSLKDGLISCLIRYLTEPTRLYVCLFSLMSQLGRQLLPFYLTMLLILNIVLTSQKGNLL